VIRESEYAKVIKSRDPFALEPRNDAVQEDFIGHSSHSVKGIGLKRIWFQKQDLI